MTQLTKSFNSGRKNGVLDWQFLTRAILLPRRHLALSVDILIASNLGGASSDDYIGDRDTGKDNIGLFGSKCQRIENLCFGWEG